MDVPSEGEEPTDYQLELLMRAAAQDAQARALVANERLRKLVLDEVQRVRQRYLVQGRGARTPSEARAQP